MRITQKISQWFEKRFSLKHPPAWFVNYFGGGEASSGVSVGHNSALQYTPFWAAVRIISGTLASLPFIVYQRQANGGKQRMPDHRIYDLVHERPNEYMDWVTFAETRQAHVLCYGNGYAEIQRDGGGRVVSLWPLLPDRTTRKIDKKGTPYYEVITDTQEIVALADYNVLHIKGLGFDGYTGYDVVRYHKEAIGYGMAVKEYGARFYGNGANPGGVLEHPQTLSNEAHKRLTETWEARHQGLSNAQRVAILEEGMKWTPIGVEPQKAQAIEAQKFTVDDCSRIFQIPPHKLGSMEFSKYNNVEQLQIDFVCTTMLYWFRKWEQEIGFKLFMPSERKSLFVEILVDAALRGNTEARTAYYTAGRQWGFLSINDIRAKENMNPIGPEGDVYLDPLNMAPAGSLPDPTSAAADPADPEQEESEPDDPEPDDRVRAAHRELLVSQWRRVCTRITRAAAKGTGNGFWAAERSAARRMLIGAANAWGAVTRSTDPAAVLDRMLARRIGPGMDVGTMNADLLADELMREMGGDYANSETT